jgi:ATP-dependent protease ClpP protease subunit
VNAGHLLELADRARALMPAAPPQARSGEWFRIRNTEADRAEVFIYGVIGSDWDPGDVTAASFVAELRKITAPAIDLHVNSPGGLVFDGIAIYSALLNHPATVDVTVDGIAASAASFVSMAGDTVAIEKPAKMMIHDASGLVIGNAADMQEMADVLNELSDTIAGIYAARAGGPVSQWRDAMKRETWYSADAAVKAGLADRVGNDATESAPQDRRSQVIRARARAAPERGVK